MAARSVEMGFRGEQGDAVTRLHTCNRTHAQDRAVAAEEYERAASLRDRLGGLGASSAD